MGFTFFKEGKGCYRGRKVVSISPSGRLGIGAVCVLDFGLESWTHIVIGYDNELQLLAIDWAKAGDPGTLKLHRTNGRGVGIMARYQLAVLGISLPDRRQHCTVQYDKKAQRIIVSLEDACGSLDFVPTERF